MKKKTPKIDFKDGIPVTIDGKVIGTAIPISVNGREIHRKRITSADLTIDSIISKSDWAKVKGIKAKDFIRDLESAKKGLTWQEAANFSGFETAKGVEKALGKVGIFHSRRNGRKFDIAAKLVPKELQKGDHVIMWMLGCCTIMRIRKKNPNAAF